MDDKTRKPKTRIEHLFYDALIENSFPFNWLIYYKFKNRGYKDRDSFNATLLLGYFVSWQSTYTKKGKLKKYGYSYRSRDYIQYDIGLGYDAQKKARDVLVNEKLVDTKPMPGQAVYYKVKVNNVFKYLEAAKKDAKSKRKSDMLPGKKDATSNDLESNDINEYKDKGLKPGKQVKAITFNDYKNIYIDKDDLHKEPVITEIIDAIEYFISKHINKFPPGKNPGTWTKTLKPGTWDDVMNTLLAACDAGYERHLHDLDYDQVTELMDIYFNKNSYEKCDYSIVHFNNPKIKEILFYEWQRS